MFCDRHSGLRRGRRCILKSILKCTGTECVLVKSRRCEAGIYFLKVNSRMYVQIYIYRGVYIFFIDLSVSSRFCVDLWVQRYSVYISWIDGEVREK